MEAIDFDPNCVLSLILAAHFSSSSSYSSRTLSLLQAAKDNLVISPAFFILHFI